MTIIRVSARDRLGFGIGVYWKTTHHYENPRKSYGSPFFFFSSVCGPKRFAGNLVPIVNIVGFGHSRSDYSLVYQTVFIF